MRRWTILACFRLPPDDLDVPGLARTTNWDYYDSLTDSARAFGLWYSNFGLPFACPELSIVDVLHCCLAVCSASATCGGVMFGSGPGMFYSNGVCWLQTPVQNSSRGFVSTVGVPRLGVASFKKTSGFITFNASKLALF